MMSNDMTINNISKLLIYKDSYKDTILYIYNELNDVIIEMLHKVGGYYRGNNINDCVVKCINNININDNTFISQECKIKLLINKITSIMSLTLSVGYNNYITTCYNRSMCGFEDYYKELQDYEYIYKQIEKDCIFEGSFTNKMYKEYIRYYDNVLMICEYLIKVRQMLPDDLVEDEEDTD